MSLIWLFVKLNHLTPNFTTTYFKAMRWWECWVWWVGIWVYSPVHHPTVFSHKNPNILPPDGKEN